MSPSLLSEIPSQPVEVLRGSNVGIVGGGEFCYKLFEFFRSQDRAPEKPNIIGVADIDPNAIGLSIARQLEVFTTWDYTQLYDLEGLDVILEITHDPNLAASIARTKPDHVLLVDHFQARYLWDSLQMENIRYLMLEEFHQNVHNPQAVEALIKKSFDCSAEIISRRNERSRQIELELLDNERAQSQIIQGSTIPTFVINKNHIVTHWNKALEKMTGMLAGEVDSDDQRPVLGNHVAGQANHLQLLPGRQVDRFTVGSKQQHTADRLFQVAVKVTLQASDQ